MWFWIIVIAAIIGAIIGYINDNGKEGGAAAGGCMGAMFAGNCLFQLAITAISIIAVIWLFGAIFG
ncbi:MAG: hypothetical protein E7084_05505 [Bacteroidales bacterium]|nr:hypothetical protein [Bacteroidales bacterium]